MELKVKALSPKLGSEIPFPSYATPGSAGMDLRACIDAPVTLQPGQRVKVPTGLAIALPSADYVAYLYARSGLGNNYGVTIPNCVGVVDSDYRGEVIVGMVNLSDQPYTIQPGDRVAQMVIAPVIHAELTPVEELDDTQRGAGGFGSTGKA